jgi:hypothetical protein
VTRTLVAITLLAFSTACYAAAQEPDTLLGLRRMRLRADTLRITTPLPFQGAGRLASPRPDPAALARSWADALTRRLERRQAARWRVGLTGDTALLLVPGAAPQPVQPVLADIPVAPPGRRIQLQRYADLGLALTARFEARIDRLKNLRCTAAEANTVGSGCRQGFTPPKIEPQFNVRTGGVVGERVHVNVDYDSEREFDASNNIQVYYQGLEDEILRRVQVGNVTFNAPNSRFITGGIPSNNFGFQMEGQVGAVDWSAIFAQQKGNVVRGRTFTIGDQTLQPVDREIVDRDYEPQRFFFVQDPALLPGYPAVDVLNLSLAGLPAALRVDEVRVYRRRGTLGRTSAEQTLGGIEAVALREDSPQRAGPFLWELLTEGRDYYLDPSGLWFALTNRIDQDDFLAVSFVTASGDTTGTFPLEAGEGRADTLRLIHEPRRGTDVPTYRYEMRNVYRIAGVDDLVRESSALSILVAESERPPDSAATFLALLGIASPNDAASFDQYNRLFPRQRDPAGGAPLRDYFIVFPHLFPFASRLGPEFRNDSLYRTPTYLLRSQGPTPLYTLRLHYDSRGGDDRSQLSLGGFQIREGSERITAGGRPLVRNTDYTINYEVGQVTFLNPGELFRQPTQVTVQYEENPAFAEQPTTIYGLQTRYDFGDHGALSLIGLYQRERSNLTRPPLGYEPSSSFVGGLSGSFRFEPMGLTRLLDALPLIETEAPSRITVDAELATSRPSPNQLGVAYVETFEGEGGGTFLSLAETAWEYGSRPVSTVGLSATGLDAATLDDSTAAPLIWQNLIAVPGRNAAVQVAAQQIDPSIVTQGASQTAETVLWITMHPDTVGGLPDPVTYLPRWAVRHTDGPRWRSMSLPLSATGVDLSRAEFLEFWLYDPLLNARSVQTSLVFDFGDVFEDAVDFIPDSVRIQIAQGAGVVETLVVAGAGRSRAGQGRLDTERDPLTNAFNAAVNDNGIHGDVADRVIDMETGAVLSDLRLCRSDLGVGLVVYDWGNLAHRCTNKNGTPDSEDLNNDLKLDSLISVPREDYFRYVFPLYTDEFVVKEGGQFSSDTTAGGRWRLYRIPFRTDSIVGDPNVRRIRALRMMVVVPDQGAPESPVRIALARLRLVGAPWVKRAGTPLAGLAGNRTEGHGEVIASIVGTENRSDLGYEPPPGVTDQGASRGGGFQVGSVEINEKSLRLIGRDVRQGERAEAFYRFPEGERNFLGYRQLRAWARGRGPGWDQAHLSFYVKVAQDENNFYLYRTPVDTGTWEPEVVVEFDRWLALRGAIESRYLRGEAPDTAAARSCGGDTLAYVMCDGSYVVHVRNPGISPPNLSRVQELAVGFVRDSSTTGETAELWVDDIRLTGVVSDAGYAGAVSINVSAADLGNVTLALTRRDGNFRQLGEDPSYVTIDRLSLATSLRLERLGLERLGIAAPFNYRYDRSGSDPYFLNRSDVLAGGLEGLRRPRQSSAGWNVAVRRTRRGEHWWQKALADNLSLTANVSTGSTTTELSESRSRLTDFRGDYLVQPRPQDQGFRYLPGFLRGMLRSLPSFLRRSDMVRGLENGRLRLAPTTIGLNSQLTRTRTERTTYRSPIRTPGDTLNSPVDVRTALLRSQARVDAAPIRSTTVSVNLATDRDLRDYGDTTTIGVLTAGARRRLLGAGVGFERQRTLNTSFSYSPPLTSWLRPRYTVQTAYGISRDPNARTPEREVGDTAGAYRLPSAFNNTRTTEVGGSMDLSRLLRGVTSDSGVLRLVDRITQVDALTRTERRSQYDRPGFDPGLGYQLGLGGRDAFRSQNGRFATSASESREDRFSGGLRLPLNLALNNVSYTLRRQLSWALRGDLQQEIRTIDREWPYLQGRWSWTPRGTVAKVVTSVGASATLRVKNLESVQPSLGASEGGQPTTEIRTSTRTRSTPLTLNLTLAPRITTDLGYSRDRNRGDRSGNVTLNDNRQLSAGVRFQFRTPRELLPLPSDVQTQLRYSTSRNTGCIRRAGAEECTPISDSRRRDYSLTMDTELPPNVSAGVSVSYVLTDDVHANRKFSQLLITAHVLVSLVAGELR